ncbi:hypothetical protein QVH35_03750 [Candidatus Nitrosotenuis chungbukensis]|uniref:hypothetical protein n=1 Tax=Candidatus Nitrosotenuis chungbukensis TaxID=1353246 RepID=UPI0005B2CAA3|nr:hypothetical protein [Candidatus Nitrosotenuis chungbukensis]WKT58510.1 hypothetical protein QVH35_03750 [Candidatus Nitrosotenuis chungbukensis]
MTVEKAIRILDSLIKIRKEGLDRLKEMTKDWELDSTSLEQSIINLLEQEIEVSQFLQKEIQTPSIIKNNSKLIHNRKKTK